MHPVLGLRLQLTPFTFQPSAFRVLVSFARAAFEELLIELVAQRLASADCARRGWVLDGVPQTARQALLLRQHKITPDCILLLEAPEVSLRRSSHLTYACAMGSTAYCLAGASPVTTLQHPVELEPHG